MRSPAKVMESGESALHTSGNWKAGMVSSSGASLPVRVISEKKTRRGNSPDAPVTQVTRCLHPCSPGRRTDFEFYFQIEYFELLNDDTG